VLSSLQKKPKHKNLKKHWFGTCNGGRSLEGRNDSGDLRARLAVDAAGRRRKAGGSPSRLRTIDSNVLIHSQMSGLEGPATIGEVLGHP
jgi:hypothetical protein